MTTTTLDALTMADSALRQLRAQLTSTESRDALSRVLVAISREYYNEQEAQHREECTRWEQFVKDNKTEGYSKPMFFPRFLPREEGHTLVDNSTGET